VFAPSLQQAQATSPAKPAALQRAAAVEPEAGHEITQVVQQREGKILRRAVPESHVSCRRTGLTGGVPGGVISGADAVSTIRASAARAAELARGAEQRIANARAAGAAPDPDLEAALTRRFGLSLANAAHARRIAFIQREFASVAGFLESSYPFYVCRDPDCDTDDWALTTVGEHTIRLCNPFWNSTSANLRASTFVHEAMHLWWDQIDDQGSPPMHNAHCFEQFALDMAGLTGEIPADFVAACTVP
jgi:hypothetical protein